MTWADWLAGGLRFTEVTNAKPSTAFAKAMTKVAAESPDIAPKSADDQHEGKGLITVNVFLLHEGKQVSVRLSPFARVARVKSCIQTTHGLEPNQQVLVYRSLNCLSTHLFA